MAQDPGNGRVLVVDDLEQVRSLIRRALSMYGYGVDVAATVAEARGMDPARYDAVVIDAQLGSERGTDLVEAMRAEDPAAAGRCLVITGGSLGALPDGVAFLTKPFRPDQLLDAVWALRRQGAAVPPWRPSCAPDIGESPLTAPDTPGPPTAAPSALIPAQAPGLEAPGAAAGTGWPLLGITRELRGRERDELAAFLHDGPIQELTAAILGLRTMRAARSGAPSDRFDAVLERLDAAAGGLRWLMDVYLPLPEPEGGLATALQQRMAWLDAPVAVDAAELAAGLGPAAVADVADVAELMLAAMVPSERAAQARLAVTEEIGLVWVELTLTPADGDAAVAGPPTAEGLPAALMALSALASALGSTIQTEFRGRDWRARVALPRRPSAVEQPLRGEGAGQGRQRRQGAKAQRLDAASCMISGPGWR